MSNLLRRYTFNIETNTIGFNARGIFHSIDSDMYKSTDTYTHVIEDNKIDISIIKPFAISSPEDICYYMILHDKGIIDLNDIFKVGDEKIHGDGTKSRLETYRYDPVGRYSSQIMWKRTGFQNPHILHEDTVICMTMKEIICHSRQL